MMTTVLGVIRAGKVELLEEVSLQEGARVLVTVLSTVEEDQFWQNVSQPALAAIWDNSQDDIYAQLLEK
jgi:hypothetical protein